MSQYAELCALYEEIEADAMWVKEFDRLAGVGDIRDLEALALDGNLSIEETIERLGMGDIVDLTMPGTGSSRIERVGSAWQEARKARDRGELPRLVIAREKAGLPVDHVKPLGTFGFGDFG